MIEVFSLTQLLLLRDFYHKLGDLQLYSLRHELESLISKTVVLGLVVLFLKKRERERERLALIFPHVET